MVPCKEFHRYEQNHYGGGSPTIIMFGKLLVKKPELLLTDLIEKLGEIKRNDVKQDLEKIMKEQKITSAKKLPTKEKDCLKKLDGEGNNWRHLADLYNFNREERSAIENAIINPNNWSPTREVLKVVCESTPNSPLKDLEAILRDMDRNDLAKVLKDFIKNYDDQQQPQQQQSQQPQPQQPQQLQQQQQPQQQQQSQQPQQQPSKQPQEHEEQDQTPQEEEVEEDEEKDKDDEQPPLSSQHKQQPIQDSEIPDNCELHILNSKERREVGSNLAAEAKNEKEVRGIVEKGYVFFNTDFYLNKMFCFENMGYFVAVIVCMIAFFVYFFC